MTPRNCDRTRPHALSPSSSANGTTRSSPQLTDYIAIPAKSPMFDADWARHGFIERVVRDAAQWVERQQVQGLKLEIVRLAGRTPVIFFEVPATRSRQHAKPSCCTATSTSSPSSTAGAATSARGRRSSRTASSTAAAAPTTATPTYASITAIAALDAQGIAQPRCVGLIETCEESRLARPACPTSTRCAPRLGDVGLVICLDSGAGNYDQLWLTTSLRGIVSRHARRCEILDEGMHSGGYGGLVPSSFRIMRQVLDRLEDAGPAACCRRASTARSRRSACAQAEATAHILGDEVWKRFPWAAATTAARCCRPRPTRARRCSTAPGGRRCRSRARTASRRSPTPATCCAPHTAFKLSLRLPPLVEATQAVAELKALLEDNRAVQREGHLQARGRARRPAGTRPISRRGSARR